MGTIQRTGGARLGWVNATFPFGSLRADKGSLTISALVASYTFAPAQVIELRPVTYFPLLAQGVKVVHCDPSAPSTVIFWGFGSPSRLVQQIQDEAGFQPGAEPPEVDSRSGMALRGLPVLALVLVWNALFAGQWIRSGGPSPVALGLLPTLAAGLVAVCAAGTLLPTPLRTVFLKRGRDVGEVRPVLTLLLLISGIFTVFGLVGLLGAGSGSLPAW